LVFLCGQKLSLENLLAEWVFGGYFAAKPASRMDGWMAKQNM